MKSPAHEEKPITFRILLLGSAITLSMIAPATRAAMPDDIRDGTYVELEGNTVAEKLVRATDVEVRIAVAGDAVVKGRIASFDPVARTINIGGVDVVAADGARLQDDDNRPMEFTGFAIGRRGKAEGTWADGVLIAHRVRLKRDKPGRENEIDLVGRATNVDRKGESFTLLGIEVLMTPSTVVEVQ